jgi:hypothetical protein
MRANKIYINQARKRKPYLPIVLRTPGKRGRIKIYSSNDMVFNSDNAGFMGLLNQLAPNLPTT